MAERHTVFLDLKRDRYLAFPPEDLVLIGSIIPSLSLFRGAYESSVDASSSRYTELVALLERDRLIVRDCEHRKGEERSVVDMPRFSYWGRDGEWPTLNRRMLLNFLIARARAAMMLRLLPIHLIVRIVRDRKWGRQIDTSAERTRAVARGFRMLQELAPFGADSCLRRSLTMVEFLARYDLYPDWVFGVQVSPFRAHCWVQDRDTVINDDVEDVEQFVPMMAV